MVFDMGKASAEGGTRPARAGPVGQESLERERIPEGGCVKFLALSYKGFL